MIVKNRAALVRAGPSLASDVVGELPKGCHVAVLERRESAEDGGKARCRVDGPTCRGWVSAHLLAPLVE